MAVSQGSIIKSLEHLVSNVNQDEFIFSFLDAYGFPKSTITRLRKEGDSRNVANGGDIGLRKQLYFRAVGQGQDLDAELELLRNSNVVARNDIRFVLVTDFENLAAFDLKARERLDIELNELDKNYAFFLPLAGYEKAIMHSEHPADLRATERMGQLFDLIRERNDLTKPEDIHALNVFLTRLLFCFYAEDTGIFEEGQVSYAIQSYTKDDGSDLDQFFTDLFTILDEPEGSPVRKQMPAHFQAFKYVNGGLFEHDEPIPEFSRKARRILLDCSLLDWSQINPDIFGSMFQAVIDKEQRGNLGQHYTSVSNIMKVIQPLFLDALQEELEKSRGSEKRLKELLVRLQGISFFDPACGSGNFLIIAYKELRRLEMEVIDALNAASNQNVLYTSGIKLNQFYGIEIDDFACEIATLALWLAEHQMNTEFKAKFGYTEATLPLKDGGNVVCGNSLRMNWEELCPLLDEQGNSREIYICGNPPFYGKKEQTKEQKKDINYIFQNIKKAGVLDYVSCWYKKSVNYMKRGGPTVNSYKVEAAFVSTNSITQGEQVSVLWTDLLAEGVSINFAHKPFSWTNSARGNAKVHCVVIGFSLKSLSKKKLFVYDTAHSEPHSIFVENINPYLIDYKDVLVVSRSKALSDCPKIIKGSEATDDGHLILTSEERDELINKYPEVQSWLRPFLGNNDFLYGLSRWCLWLGDVDYHQISSVEPVRRRIDLVRDFRAASSKAATRGKSLTPWLFGENRQPVSGTFILIPKVSSERRKYAPVAFLDAKTIINNTTQFVPYADLYHFGVIQSSMHMTWLAGVGGRLESRYQYSIRLVYNTFPWPVITESKRKHIETLAEEVLLIREDYPDKSLAELYDPDKMPATLLDAHKALDQAVETLYREKLFRDASERLEHLFARYEKLVAAEKEKVSAKKTKVRK